MPASDIQASAPAAWTDGFPTGFESYTFAATVRGRRLSHRVLRRATAGPTVILMHEVPVVSERTAVLADRFVAAGFTVVLPVLIGRPAARPGKVRMARSMGRLCISREFGALVGGQTSRIADWLRALVDHEHDPARGPAVGIVGMCFSGGFALAAALNPKVGAAVVSQPAVPFGIPGRERDLAISDAELGDLKLVLGRGECVRALRYEKDWKSPRPRLDHLQEVFPAIERVGIDQPTPKGHSVLADGLSAPDGSQLAEALEGTITFLQERLLPDRQGTI
jgi:dienelactone hydrolase